MAFHALADYQNHVIGWLQWEQSSLGDGAVVRFPRIWMSSGECRIVPLIVAKLMATMTKIGNFFRSVPLIGPLGDARKSDVKEAFVEIAVAVLISTIPIWLGSLILLADTGKDTSFIENISQNVRDGELLLFCTTLTGPIFYFIFVQNKQMPNFPAARPLMLCVVVILIVSVALFTLQRAESLFGPGGSINKDLIFDWSIIAFGIAIFISYLAACYRNFREGGAAAYQQSETAGFVDHYNEHRGD